MWDTLIDVKLFRTNVKSWTFHGLKCCEWKKQIIVGFSAIKHVNLSSTFSLFNLIIFLGKTCKPQSSIYWPWAVGPWHCSSPNIPRCQKGGAEVVSVAAMNRCIQSKPCHSVHHFSIPPGILQETSQHLESGHWCPVLARILPFNAPPRASRQKAASALCLEMKSFCSGVARR